MGSSTGGGGATNLPNVSGVSSQLQNSITGMPGQNYGASAVPGISGLSQQLSQQSAPALNPFAQQAMTGATNAQNIGNLTAGNVGSYAQGLVPYAQQLQQAGQGLLPYAQQIQQMGFDPQKALYNRTLQQTQDQARVANAKAGVANSPFGAGLEAQATNNFNIDWQNQQLNRATQAATSAGGLDTAAAGLGTAGAGLGSSAFNLGSGASSLAQTAGAAPYTTQTGLWQNRINALAGGGPLITQANQPQQAGISDFLSYLGLGPGYQSSAAAAQQANTAQTTGLAGIPLSLIGKH